jgi:hypothetical protein
MQIRLGALAVFVDHMAGYEAIKSQRGGGPMACVTRNQVGKGET